MNLFLHSDDQETPAIRHVMATSTTQATVVELSASDQAICENLAVWFEGQEWDTDQVPAKLRDKEAWRRKSDELGDRMDLERGVSHSSPETVSTCSCVTEKARVHSAANIEKSPRERPTDCLRRISLLHYTNTNRCR
jgi:hypothetical protein